jgi:transposase
MKRGNPQVRYSEEFKRRLVEEIETGVMTISQACRFYGICSTNSIYKWISLYGMNQSKGKQVYIMTTKEETELIMLRRELALLKKQLNDAEERAIAWKCMVDAIEIDLGIPVKKKPWNQALLDARKTLKGEEADSVPKDTAASSESPNKPDTKEKHPLKRK